MRVLSVVWLLPWIGFAQSPQPAALVRGVLLERDTGMASGQFSIRNSDNQVFRFQFDRRTYVEREKLLIDVARLTPGDKVEVVSDVVGGSPLRYARTIHVLGEPAPVRPQSANRARGYRPAEEPVLTGNLTFSGVVYRAGPDRLVLHTRGGDQTLQLRKDTRYLQDGEIVESATLKPNMRVFIRAGRDLYGQVEAYQIIWGSILAPK
jgi:hypothetical protein